MDHELFRLRNGIFADSMGYEHEKDTFLGILSYTPDKNGSKIIDGNRYRKRFLTSTTAEEEINRIHDLGIFPSDVESYVFRIPKALVEKAYDPRLTFSNMKTEKEYGEFIRRISGIFPGIDLGIVGSTQTGNRDLRDLDLLVYGNIQYNNALNAIKSIKLKDSSIMTERTHIENKIKDKMRFYKGTDSDTLWKMYLRKEDYKMNLDGLEVSLWARFMPEEIKRVRIKGFGEIKEFRYIITDDRLSQFSPTIYMSGKNILISYDRLLRGAFKTGDIIEGKSRKIYAELDGKMHEGQIFKHEDNIGFAR